MRRISTKNTYTDVRNTDGDWIQNDIEECKKTSNPEAEDQKNDQPDDEPQSLHDLLKK